ncbi:hypothetical protein [Umezawaea sp.]
MLRGLLGVEFGGAHVVLDPLPDGIDGTRGELVLTKEEISVYPYHL